VSIFSTLVQVGLGGLVGATLALTGAGGGVLAVPLLMFCFGLDVAHAAPAGLIAIGLAALLGAMLGLREGTVRPRAALLIGSAGMLSAPVGIALAQRLPAAPLAIAFSLVLARVAVAMYRRSTGAYPERGSSAVRPCCTTNAESGRLVWTFPCARALVVTGLFSGLMTGLLGVGGGFVVVPALTIRSDLPPASVVSTSLAVIALVSASSVVAAAAHGIVDWSTALPFASGAAIALVAVRPLVSRWSGAALQRAFAVLSLVIATLVFLRGLTSFAGSSPIQIH